MSFTVRIEPSGHTFDVESNESVLDAALRHGYSFPYGCRGGGCGACKGKVLNGTVDYGTNLPPALSEEDVSRGLALFCQARPSSDLSVEIKEVGESDNLEIKTLPTKVQKKEFLSHDVVRLYLKLPEIERMQFRAGQYIDILLPDGRKRSFSLANAPHDDALIELHIRHVDGGDFTGYVMDELHEKDILRIEGPHGSFFLREEAKRPLIFMAGGTGFAPIKGIIEHALAEGLNQPMYLYWGVRTEKDLYLADLPAKWAKHLPHFHFIPIFSEQPSATTPASNAQAIRSGYVHDAVVSDFPEGLEKFDVYASGPPVMVHAGFDAFKKHGLLEDRYFSDAFEFQTPKAK
ncbi:MAG: CDP-6-deoxy-delta-3,4-glucoseen reductase [Ectothiorhodospiraceae bacterium]|nr:CDP-6-deoxy-delta-3,4-glucoseen reductase [Ectothiorhodospiraceae bacterium]